MTSSAAFIDTFASLRFFGWFVVSRYFKYFYFFDDPIRDIITVCANHPSGHQIEGPP